MKPFNARKAFRSLEVQVPSFEAYRDCVAKDYTRFMGSVLNFL